MSPRSFAWLLCLVTTLGCSDSHEGGSSGSNWLRCDVVDDCGAASAVACEEGFCVDEEGRHILDPASAAAVAASASKLSVEALMDPQACKDCHPKHYAEWSGSMHAHAAESPVFIAMNERARDDGAELGDFCLECHAPMAVKVGRVTDIDSLLELPPDQGNLKGITCYFCHNAVSVDGDHNASVELAMDQTMRGGIRDAAEPATHFTAYSSLLDGSELGSSDLCGGCHDIVTPNGVAVGRTFQEYRASVFGGPAGQYSCSACHMSGWRGVVAEDPGTSVPTRSRHEHLWAGVDVGLDELPHEAEYRSAVACELANGTRGFGIFPNPAGEVEVTLGTDAGHNQPSGVPEDRRVWLELVAYDADDNVIFASGDVADDEIVDKAADDPDYDPNLWLFRDRLYDADGADVHMLWEAAPSAAHPEGYESLALPAASEVGRPHTVTRVYQVGVVPDRITTRLRMRPIGLDVLQSLVDSGHLDEAYLSKLQTFTLYGTAMEWNRDEDGYAGVDGPDASPLDCPQDYLCAYDPESDRCR